MLLAAPLHGIKADTGFIHNGPACDFSAAERANEFGIWAAGGQEAVPAIRVGLAGVTDEGATAIIIR